MWRASCVRCCVPAARVLDHHLAFAGTPAACSSRLLPEHEYQVRLGAAIRHLRATLPQFMQRGLVDRDEAPSAGVDTLAPYLEKSALISRARLTAIYHKDIYFRFRPPLPPLPPLPSGEAEQHFAPAFSLRGRRMYRMSAQALRYSLHALFVDTDVRIEHMTLLPDRASVVVDVAPGKPVPGDELLTRIRFRGTNRVSGALQDFTLLFRYRFDRNSGMVCEHHVDQMMPVPGRRVWQSLANVRSRLA